MSLDALTSSKSRKNHFWLKNVLSKRLTKDLTFERIEKPSNLNFWTRNLSSSLQFFEACRIKNSVCAQSDWDPFSIADISAYNFLCHAWLCTWRAAMRCELRDPLAQKYRTCRKWPLRSLVISRRHSFMGLGWVRSGLGWVRSGREMERRITAEGIWKAVVLNSVQG